MEDSITTVKIANGTKTTQLCAYVTPNCVTGCFCCPTSTFVICNCNPGYHMVYTPDRDGCTCEKNCTTGFYGDGRVCSPCPAPGTTDAAIYSNQITECFVPANENITDNSGTYQYTANCKYTN